MKIGIVGAGPKAAAIVAHVAVLNELRFPNVPEVVVFEEDHIGSAWSGQSDFSSGYLTLCTPGEKDVGFPYHSFRSLWRSGPSIAEATFSRFSWSKFLVTTGGFSNWVDRGRQYPTHQNWSSYLEWVFREAGNAPVIEKINKVYKDGANWMLSSGEGDTSKHHSVNGVVLTGTGNPRRFSIDSNVPSDRVFDAKTFWSRRDELRLLGDDTILVVGDGGAAGTILAWLANRYAESEISIKNVSRMGTLFPRGDGYAERRWHSDDGHEWSELNFSHRKEIISRTDAGVISDRNKSIIDNSTNIIYIAGEARKAHFENEDIILTVMYGEDRTYKIPCKYLVSSIGFDTWSLIDIVDHPHVKKINEYIVGSNKLSHKAGELRKSIELNFLPDLSFPPSSGLPSGLHVPGLAGLARGPGIGSLGSLGLMAEAIVRPYLVPH